jgi:hypothetical protein
VSSNPHPFGLTEYERLEEAGEPYIKHRDDDGMNVWDVGERMPEHPSYFVIGSFALSNQGPQLIGIRFSPYTYPTLPPPALTAVIIRSASVSRLYELVRGYVSISPQLGIPLDIDLEEFARNPRPGRRGRPDAFYARLAAQYVDLLRTSSTPTKDLAELRNYSASSTRDFLNQARKRGLLTPSSVGRAGGELTEKARELINVPPEAHPGRGEHL